MVEAGTCHLEEDKVQPHLADVLVLNPDGVRGKLEAAAIARPAGVGEVGDLLRALELIIIGASGPDCNVIG